MLEYYKDPMATAQVIEADGWFHMGDLGYLDEDGYLYISGRKKNLIILSNGENVSAEELENKIISHPSVLDVIVKEKNDRICAEIYCDESEREAVRDFIWENNKGKAMWKRITDIEFRDTPFPKNSTGKIIRQ